MLPSELSMSWRLLKQVHDMSQFWTFSVHCRTFYVQLVNILGSLIEHILCLFQAPTMFLIFTYHAPPTLPRPTSSSSARRKAVHSRQEGCRSKRRGARREHASPMIAGPCGYQRDLEEARGMSNGQRRTRARAGKRVGEASKKIRIPSAMMNTLTMMRKVGRKRPACGQGAQRDGKLPKMRGCTRVSISPLSMANDPAPDDEGVHFIRGSEEATRMHPCARFLRSIDAATPGE